MVKYRALCLILIVALALSTVPAPSTATEWTMDISEPDGAKIGQTFWVNVTGVPGALISISFWLEPGYHIGIGYTHILNSTGKGVQEVCIADPIYAGNYTIQVFYEHESMVRVTNYTITYDENYWLNVRIVDYEDRIADYQSDIEYLLEYAHDMREKRRTTRAVFLLICIILVILLFRKPIIRRYREQKEINREYEAMRKRRRAERP